MRAGQVVDASSLRPYDDSWRASPPAMLHLANRLGGGTFAQVFRAVDDQGREVAAKCLRRKTYAKSRFLRTMLKREVRIHSRLVHSNICRLFGGLATPDHYVFVQELATSGNLFRYSCRRRKDENEVKLLVRDVLNALQYCHEKNIIHGDIKPDNILLEQGDRLVAKLADFGGSLKVAEGQVWRGGGACDGDYGEEREVGTPNYCAPEIWDLKRCGPKVDVWAVGVVMFEVFHDYIPFQCGSYGGRPDSFQLRFPPDSDVSPLAHSLTRALLTEDADARPSSTEALQHPWFQSST